MADTEIAEFEQQIYQLTTRLNALRKSNRGEVVPSYDFATENGEISLNIVITVPIC